MKTTEEHQAPIIGARARFGALVPRSDPLARWARNTLISLLPASLRLKQLESLIGYEV